MSAATAEPGTASSPPSRRRRWGGFAAIGVGLLAVAAVGALVTSPGWTQREALDPESAGPTGTRALARILADQGVDVRIVRDLTSAQDALAADGATLVMPDAPFLADRTIASLAGAADDVVLIEPRARTLDLLLDGSSPLGAASAEPLTPDCSLEVAERAGPIVTGALFDAGAGVTACYPADSGAGLLVGDRDGATVTAVDGVGVLANDALAKEGNAALALGLTGRNPVLVWYVPSLADADATEAAPTLGELTPPWVSPALVLLAAAAAASAVWRGRRFGPLVAEDLPVTVRGSETTEGRARLYARSRDAAHALAQLRVGALERIGRQLGLGPSASAAAIADAAAARVGADRAEVRSILVDFSPTTDRELVEASDRLRALEARVSAAVRPERNSP